MKNKAVDIFLSAVERVKPQNLMHSSIQLKDKKLIIQDISFYIDDFENIYLLAAGKAAALMAKEAEKILSNRITDGHVITKYGHGATLKYLSITEAGHPIPDTEGIKGTQELIKIAQKATDNDLIICLISGGASALMADVPKNITLDDLKLVNDLLVRSGADITEINTIRKHLSDVKGGQLARITYPATTITLILSDVVGDKPDVIASGPTVPDSSTFSDALSVINKYNLKNQFPKRALENILKGIDGSIPETPKQNNPIFEKTYNKIIGSNKTALEAALKKADKLGFHTKIVTDSLQEDYKLVADFILKEIDKNKSAQKPICLLFGGEPTVKVTGNGLGGRNQHLALYLATKIQNMKGITILCAGTDGTDGPTDAAGAVVDWDTAPNAVKSDIDINKHLTDFDAYHFFEKTNGLIKTGNTGTNVIDIIVVLINN